MSPNPFPETIPPRDLPVLVFPTLHGFQVAANKGITTPAFICKPMGRTSLVEVEGVVCWWNLPEAPPVA